MTYPSLETKRLMLRPLMECDLDNMFNLQTNEKVNATLEVTVPRDFVKYRKEFMEALNSGAYYAIHYKESSEFVGYIFLHQYIKKNAISYSQIGTAIIPEYWNKGICAEALTKLLHFAFVGIKTPWLCANQFQINPAASKVLRNCGLTYFKTYKMNNLSYDQYRYTKDDYFNRNPYITNDDYDYIFDIKVSPYSYDKPIRQINNIQYRKQPTEYLCGQAVVAMLADVSVDEVIEVMHNDKGTSTSMIREALNYYGIKTSTKTRVKYTFETILPDCAILSIQLPGYGHWSLYYKSKYYDPEFGVIDDLPDDAKLCYYLEIVL